MKVFIVQYEMDYDGSFIEEVYDSHFKAVVHIEKKIKEDGGRNWEWRGDTVNRCVGTDTQYTISECEVL